MIWIAWLVACHPSPQHKADRVDWEPADTGDTPIETTSDSGGSGGTSDTGSISCEVAIPTAASSGHERVPDVRLTAEWSLQAGWSVRFGNVDADRCDELLVGEPRNEDAINAEQPEERVDLVEAPVQSGSLADRATMIAESDGGATVNSGMHAYAQFGWDVRVDEPDGALLIGAPINYDDFDVASFPLDADHVVRPSEALGRIVASSQANNSLFHSFLGTIDLSRGRFLWSGGWDTIGDYTFAGHVYLFDLPLIGDHDEQDARAFYHADPGDYVQYGLSDDDDLDGDGIRDLVFGAHARLSGMGAIAVLSDPPDGDHGIWDLAVATFEGTEPDGRFGDQVASGDLDGDGYPDLLSGAAEVFGTNTFHAFEGPVAGDRLADSSDWIIHGQDGVGRLGVSSAAADLDGDGATDLVVGRPGDPAISTLDGSVVVFRGPLPPGIYEPTAAALVITNAKPPGTGDFFGIFLRTGDLNGDGSAELAIGSPEDMESGKQVGSVQILYGRPELFDP